MATGNHWRLQVAIKRLIIDDVYFLRLQKLQFKQFQTAEDNQTDYTPNPIVNQNKNRHYNFAR